MRLLHRFLVLNTDSAVTPQFIYLSFSFKNPAKSTFLKIEVWGVWVRKKHLLNVKHIFHIDSFEWPFTYTGR